MIAVTILRFGTDGACQRIVITVSAPHMDISVMPI